VDSVLPAAQQISQKAVSCRRQCVTMVIGQIGRAAVCLQALATSRKETPLCSGEQQKQACQKRRSQTPAACNVSCRFLQDMAACTCTHNGLLPEGVHVFEQAIARLLLM
jgi:hypothetical protein